jgi:predicted nucleic acid-binding Zn ribbon protein
MNQGPNNGIADEREPCGCGMNACCGECLHKERRRHLAVLWLTTGLVLLFAVALSLIVGTRL